MPAPTSASRSAAPHLDWPLASLLVVDDEQGMRNFLEKTLATRCGTVRCAPDAESADQLVRHHRFDLIILDITLPGKSGITWLRELREQGYAGEVVLITAFADLDTAIEALRAGASDFILKPFRVTQILNAVKHGLERARLHRENWVLRRAWLARTPPAGALVGGSIAIKGLQAALHRVAAVNSTVLLTGESGTGKELAALALHHNSPRAAGPFVPVNCATMSAEQIESELFGHAKGVASMLESPVFAAAGAGAPTARDKGRDGLFVYAQGGTLFLDEIGDLPVPLQATLLRVLEDRRIRPVGSEQEIPVDVRIVAATNRPLAPEVAAGRFRNDLYYRLNVICIRLPPLRERAADLGAICTAVLERIAREAGVMPVPTMGDDALHFLSGYAFPGNVRELENLLQRALALSGGEVIARQDLGLSDSSAGEPVTAALDAVAPPAAAAAAPPGALLGTPAAPVPLPGDLQAHLDAVERDILLRALERFRYNRTAAGASMGLSLRQMRYRMARLGVSTGEAYGERGEPV